MNKKIKTIFLLTFFLLIGKSCNKKLSKALKSSNKEEILEKANEFEGAKKYDEALQLYDYLISIGVESSLKKEIDYKKAWINYEDENYILASHLFKNFHKIYPDDKRGEEVLFQSSYCHFLLSADYNLDQKETYKALEELQAFINYYPDSKKRNEVNELMRQLEIKLEKKAFFLAKNYYDVLKYKEAILSFENFISDFPRSSFKEEALFYILKSQVEIAAKSLEDLKEERKEKALASYEKLKNDYPNSSFIKKAYDLLTNKLKIILNQKLN